MRIRRLFYELVFSFIVIASFVAIEGPHAQSFAQPEPLLLSSDAAPSDDVSQNIEKARPHDNGSTSSPTLVIRAQTLLDRAHFSPGEIDGRNGANLKAAIAAYTEAHGLPISEEIDDALLNSLAAGDRGPVLQHYTITPGDAKGPFIGVVPKDLRLLARLKMPAYGDPLEALAEKFHMSPELLQTLNPNADFSTAGTVLLVVRPSTQPLPPVARLEVDKTANQVRAYGESDDLVAIFPATVGSSELPAPSGSLHVVFVSHNPHYHYDPKKLSWGPKSAGRLTINPGPNNPVGTAWIALSRSGFGIHGAPEPRLIGKSASHGCVRLTNWDAALLGAAVAEGTPVQFVGKTPPGRAVSRA